MAQVYRPSYTATDPTTGKKVKKNSPTWHIRYYAPSGERKHAKGFTDKRATQALALELERRAEREAAGLSDPTEAHSRRPLIEHAEDFRRYTAAKDSTEEYVAKLHFRLSAVLNGCGFALPTDLQPSRVVEYLAELRREGKSVKTANDYLASAKAFTRWLWRDKRTLADALASLSKLPNGEADLRHARRDFSPEELRRLLEAAQRSSTAFLGLSGSARYFLYLAACATGFRASELASMTPESFELGIAAPLARVEAACTKNRKLAVQPLPFDVAKALEVYLQGKGSRVLLWPGTWSVRGAAMIRGDLAEARETWLAEAPDERQRVERANSDFLAYKISDGLYADFHALRHSYITMVGKTGVSAREHQDLARHSTYALTSRYSHSKFYDLSAAVNGLSIPTTTSETAGPQSQTMIATGTHGAGIEPQSLCSTADTGRDVLRLAERKTRPTTTKKPWKIRRIQRIPRALSMQAKTTPKGT